MNTLPQPPQLSYASLEQARAAIDVHAQQEGYAVAIRHTRRIGKKKDGEIKALILVCSQSSPPVTLTAARPRQRRSSSCSTGCLFKVSIRRLEAGDWQVQVDNGEHNHDPFTHKSARRQGRALTEENQPSVLTQTHASVTPSHIVPSLRQNSNGMTTAQDIHNLRNPEDDRVLTYRYIEPAPVGMKMALKRIADEYKTAPYHRKRVLLDHLLAVPEAVTHDPVQVQTRDQPTGSTQPLLPQVEHGAAAVKAPVRRRQCRTCQQTGHNARTCRRQAPAAAIAPRAAPAIAIAPRAAPTALAALAATAATTAPAYFDAAY